MRAGWSTGMRPVSSEKEWKEWQRVRLLGEGWGQGRGRFKTAGSGRMVTPPASGKEFLSERQVRAGCVYAFGAYRARHGGGKRVQIPWAGPGRGKAGRYSWWGHACKKGWRHLFGGFSALGKKLSHSDLQEGKTGAVRSEKRSWVWAMCHGASAAEACALRDQSMGATQSVASRLGSQSTTLLPWAAGIMPAGQRGQTAFRVGCRK